MNEKQYFAARKRAEEDLADKLRSLEMAWAMLHGKPPPKSPAKAAKRRTANGSSGLMKTIAAVLDGMPAEFTTLDVSKVFAAEYPEISAERSSITHALKRLADAPSATIRIIEPGKGKRPTRYAKIGQESRTATD